MSTFLSRRRFLRRAMDLGAGIGLASAGAAFARPIGKGASFQLSLAEWSLHRALFSGKISNLDFPSVAREQFGIGAVEYVNQFFKDKAKDHSYLAELKKRSEGAGVRNLLIMVDGEGALGHAAEKERAKAIENHYKWVEAAKFLGCHSIRVNAESTGSYHEQSDRAADGLRRLSIFAAKYGLNVLVENHGGLSSHGAWLAAVIRKVGLPTCGTLPDFGNFDLGNGQEYNRYRGVAEMMPYAKAVSAKSHDFDEKGEETKTDFMRMMKIVADSGYRGYIGIEYEGNKLSEPAGIESTRKLLARVLDTLAYGGAGEPG